MANISDNEYIELLKIKHETAMDKARESRSELYKELQEVKQKYDQTVSWLASCKCRSDQQILFNFEGNGTHIGYCQSPHCGKYFMVVEVSEKTAKEQKEST